MDAPALRPTQAAAFYGAYFAVLGVLLPFLGPYLAGRGIAPATIGWVVAAFSLVRAFYSPLVGRVADLGHWRHGWLAAHLLAAAVAAAAVPWAPSVTWVVVGVVVLGSGHGAVLPLVEAHLLASPLARSYGPLRLWGSLAFIAVASGASPAIARWPHHAVPLIAAAGLAVTAFACRPFEFSSASPAGPARTPPLGTRTWLLLAVLGLNQVAHGPFYAMLSLDLERHGWSPAAIGLTWSAGVAAETVLFAVGGRLAHRFRLETLLTVALVITPGRWLLFALPPSLWSVTAGHLGHAASFALAHLAGVQLVQAWAPPAASRRVQSLYSGLTFGLCIAIGSAASGPLFAALGGRLLFLLTAGLSTVAALAWWALSVAHPRHGAGGGGSMAP